MSISCCSHDTEHMSVWQTSGCLSTLTQRLLCACYGWGAYIVEMWTVLLCVHIAACVPLLAYGVRISVYALCSMFYVCST